MSSFSAINVDSLDTIISEITNNNCVYISIYIQWLRLEKIIFQLSK